MSTLKALRVRPAFGGTAAAAIILFAFAPFLQAAPPDKAKPKEGAADAAKSRAPAPAEPAEEDDAMPPLPPDRAGRPRDGAGPQRGAMAWARMPEEERTRFREFLAEQFPARFDELSALEERDPQLFAGFVGRLVPEILRLRDLREHDPQLFELRKKEMENEFKVRRLGRRYRFTTDETAKAALEKDIRAAVEEHFDLRTARESQELARLEKRLEQLRARTAKRQTDRAEVIDNVVADILAGRPGGPELDGKLDGPPPDGRGRLRNREGAADEGQPPAERPRRAQRERGKRPPAPAAPAASPAPPAGDGETP